MFNVVIDYLPEDDEVAVVKQTTSRNPEPINALFHGEDVLRFHEVVRRVPIAEDIIRMAVKIAAASRPKQKNTADFVNQFVGWGAGTRAAQFLVLGAKARALMQGRAHVTEDDIRALALPVLRHRILVNYRAEAEGMTVDNIVERLLKERGEPARR
jgi:MoxR-like ATPase